MLLGDSDGIADVSRLLGGSDAESDGRVEGIEVGMMDGSGIWGKVGLVDGISLGAGGKLDGAGLNVGVLGVCVGTSEGELAGRSDCAGCSEDGLGRL